MSLFIDIVRRIPSIIAPSCQHYTIFYHHFCCLSHHGVFLLPVLCFCSKQNSRILRRHPRNPHLVSAIHIHLRPNLAGIPLDSMSQDQFNSPKKMAVQSTNKMSIERIETWRKTRFVTISKHVFSPLGLMSH